MFCRLATTATDRRTRDESELQASMCVCVRDGGVIGGWCCGYCCRVEGENANEDIW